MEYNDQEKQQLNQNIRQEIARKRAEELGVDSSDVMQRVSDGKTAWVKKSDVYIQLDKQRKLVEPKKVVRSLRDGKNSLVARIQREVGNCRKLSNDLSKETLPASFNISEIKTSITKLENRTNSLHNQLADAESRIDRTKAKDPVFAEAEAVLAKVRDARGNNDAAESERLLIGNKDLLAKYEVLRKSLKPHLDEARKFRLELQKEFWQIMESRFKMQAVSIQTIKKQLAIVASDQKKQGVQPDFLIEATELMQLDENYTKQYRNLASHTPPSHIPPKDASRLWDCIHPEMETITSSQEALLQKFATLRLPHQEKEDVASRNEKRMAFSHKRR